MSDVRDVKFRGCNVCCSIVVYEPFCIHYISQIEGFGLVSFVLFNDTWSQKGHSVSCMTILFTSKCKSSDQTSGHT